MSKSLCRKCYNDTINAYTFRKKCLDTNRTLLLAIKSLENKLKSIQGSLSTEEIFLKNENTSFEADNNISDEETDNDNQLIEYECIGMDDEISSDEDMPASKNEEQQEEVVEYIEEYEQVEYLEDSFSDSNFQCTYCEHVVIFKTDFGMKKHLYEEHQIGGSKCIK